MFGTVIIGLQLYVCKENITIGGFWQGVNVCKMWPQIPKIKCLVIKEKNNNNNIYVIQEPVILTTVFTREIYKNAMQ